MSGLSLGAVESQENGFGEVGSSIITWAVLAPTVQPRMTLIPDASHYASGVPWSASCLVLFLITFINVLQRTIWRTVKKLRGATDFMVLTGQWPCVRSSETCSRAPWPAWKIKESGRVGHKG